VISGTRPSSSSAASSLYTCFTGSTCASASASVDDDDDDDDDRVQCVNTCEKCCSCPGWLVATLDANNYWGTKSLNSTLKKGANTVVTIVVVVFVLIILSFGACGTCSVFVFVFLFSDASKRSLPFQCFSPCGIWNNRYAETRIFTHVSPFCFVSN
jgi:hypothetical protein